MLIRGEPSQSHNPDIRQSFVFGLFHPVEPEADYHTERGGQTSLRRCPARARRRSPPRVFCGAGN
jgi:hypothetical protein